LVTPLPENRRGSTGLPRRCAPRNDIPFSVIANEVKQSRYPATTAGLRPPAMMPEYEIATGTHVPSQ
ncbi:MAG: hypothetical protein ABSD79_03665, partial [Dehalococcoidales bacterium]